MSEEIKELMQKKVIGENEELSDMLADIVPVKEQIQNRLFVHMGLGLFGPNILIKWDKKTWFHLGRRRIL